MSRTRLTLDLSDRLNAAVDRMAAERGATKSEILRTALDLLLVAEIARADGMHVGAWKDGPSGSRIERVFVGI